MDVFYFIIKNSLILSIFLLIYRLFLRKETFYQVNRIFLLGGIIFSLSLPFIHIQSTYYALSSPEKLQEIQIGIETAITESQSLGFDFSWGNVLGGIYVAGVVFLLLRMGFSYIQLFRLAQDSRKSIREGIHYYETDEQISPFSIFKRVIYNPNLHSAEDLTHILQHEMAHIRLKHSTDLLVSQLFCLLLWFNPLVWIYHQKIIRNIEFQADSEAGKNLSSLKAYQYALVRTSLPVFQHIPTTNFNQSFLKSRIMMLQKEKSNPLAVLKTGLVLPLLVAFFLGFQMKVKAQEKTDQEVETVAFQTVQDLPIYPGCEETSSGKERGACLQKKIMEFLHDNFNSKQFKGDKTIDSPARINTQFTIDENGNPTNFKILSKDDRLSKEAERVLSLLPQMEPGKMRDRPVRVTYTLPIVLMIE